MKNTSLAGHKIIVTGGSRGIGAGIVQHLAESGAEVAFTYSSREESAKEILAKLPGSGHFCVQMNIADEASVQSGLEQILKKWLIELLYLQKTVKIVHYLEDRMTKINKYQ